MALQNVIAQHTQICIQNLGKTERKHDILYVLYQVLAIYRFSGLKCSLCKVGFVFKRWIPIQLSKNNRDTSLSCSSFGIVAIALEWVDFFLRVVWPLLNMS